MNELDEINELVALKDFEIAKGRLEVLLQSEPNNIEAQKLLGLCQINLGNFKECKNIFENVVKFKNDDALAWFYLGNCYSNLDDYLHAKTAYLEVIKLREDYIDAYKNLCIVYIKTQELDKAIELALANEHRAPDDYSFNYLLGTAYLAQHKYEMSIPCLEKAITLNPTHAQLYNNLGTAFLTLKKYDKAYENYLFASKLEPFNALTYYNIGTILQIQNKHEEACGYFQKAYDYENQENYLVSLALSAFKAEQYDLAISKYKLLVTLHPEKHNFQYNLACCYEKIGEYEFAVGILSQLVFLNPNAKAMSLKLADLYMKLNQPLNAKQIYQNLIANGGVSADIYYEYALICAKTNDVDIAETLLKKVIELNPNFANARKDLAVIYLNKRLFDYAKDEFQKAYEYSPNDFGIIFEFANFLHATSDYVAAEEYYKKAFEVNPNEPNMLVFRALNSLLMNNLSDAKTLIENALNIASDSDFILFTAGKVYFGQRDYQAAKSVLVKACELNQSLEIQNLLALTYYELGEFEKANNIFVNLLDSNENNTMLLFNSAKCYEKLDKIEEASMYLNKALEIFPEFDDAQELLDKLGS